MQLFGNNQNNESKVSSEVSQEFIVGRISGFQVAILSNRSDLIDKAHEILFLYNVLSIEIMPVELSDLKEDPIWNKFDAIIVDIRDQNNAESISETINRYIPIKTTAIVVGSNDSISFYEQLLKKGIHFLLEKNQLEKIPVILHTRSLTPTGSSQRIGSVVSFLACKGCIGTSYLAVHTLKKSAI